LDEKTLRDFPGNGVEDMPSKARITVVLEVAHHCGGAETLDGLNHPSRFVGPELEYGVVAMRDGPSPNGFLPVRRVGVHPRHAVCLEGSMNRSFYRENIDFPFVMGVFWAFPNTDDKELGVS
jgi:hypothetical protein